MTGPVRCVPGRRCALVRVMCTFLVHLFARTRPSFFSLAFLICPRSPFLRVSPQKAVKKADQAAKSNGQIGGVVAGAESTHLPTFKAQPLFGGGGPARLISQPPDCWA